MDESRAALTVDAKDWKPGLYTRESSAVRYVVMAHDTMPDRWIVWDTIEHEEVTYDRSKKFCEYAADYHNTHPNGTGYR